MRYAIAPLLFSLVCISSAAVADDDGPVVPPVTYPALARHAPTAEAFVPAGWRIESQKSGDLNGDGRADVVLVLRDADPHNVVDARERGGPQNYDTNPRIIVVAFAAAAGGYDLALENHTLVGRTTEPSAQDPLDPNGVQAGGVEIRKGTLQVTLGYFAGNMGRKTYTFRAHNGHFELIGYDSIDVDRSSGTIDQVSANFSTRRMKHSGGKISDDADKVTWTTLPAKPLLTVEQIGDGLDFQPPEK
ncbi:MAG TPA: hypothetical protein VHT93_20590 [Pseudolabrys sp.]|jgi:hypothetical protein|nr:hypothetical protein [Pseudolabrys sp.]